MKKMRAMIVASAFLSTGGGIALADAAPAPTPAADAQSPAAGAPSPAAGAPSAARPVEDPAVTAAVKKQFLAGQAGKIDRSAYNDKANAAFTDAKVADVSSKLQTLGAPSKFTFVDQASRDDNTIYLYTVEAAKGNLQMIYAVDATGKISGIGFRPAA